MPNLTDYQPWIQAAAKEIDDLYGTSSIRPDEVAEIIQQHVLRPWPCLVPLRPSLPRETKETPK